MDEKKIARINQLHHASKARDLSPEEVEEQAALRKEYIAAYRKNLKSKLDSISIREEDGSITHLKDKYGSKSCEKSCKKSCGNSCDI